MSEAGLKQQRAGSLLPFYISQKMSSLPACYQSPDYGNNCDDQKRVDDTTCVKSAQKTNKPDDNQNNRDQIK
jgi:hypothetical protein